MAYFDQSSSVVPLIALGEGSVSDNTPRVGNIIDTNDFGAFTFYVLIDALVDADATFAVTFEEGDDSGLSDAAAVPAENLIGNADFDFNDDNSITHVGYVGKKRFVQATVTPSGNSSSATFRIMVVKTMPVSAPSDPNVQ